MNWVDMYPVHLGELGTAARASADALSLTPISTLGCASGSRSEL